MTVTEIFTKIYQLQSEVNWYGKLSPEELDKFWAKIRLEWNYHSNKLANLKFTIEEIQQTLLGGGNLNVPDVRNSIQIQGHHDAVEDVIQFSNEGRPISENYIKDLHHLL